MSAGPQVGGRNGRWAILLFLKIEKSGSLILEKKALIVFIFGLNFAFKKL